jgi:hypothetical protein
MEDAKGAMNMNNILFRFEIVFISCSLHSTAIYLIASLRKNRGKSSVCSSVRNPINPGQESEPVKGIDRYSGIINGMQTT